MAEKEKKAKDSEQKQQAKAKPKKGRTVDKWKKKQWYTIIAPAEFDKAVIGETVGERPKNVEGRIIRVDLGQLAGQRQKRYISVLFRVERVEGNNANCITIGHEAAPGFVNRLVRRRTSKIEAVQTLETSDGKKVHVKTIALSARKLSRQQEADIRKSMADMIKESVEKKLFVQVSQEMIFGAVASKIFKQLSKIAPLKRVEVIKSRLIEGK
jgi:small subunit ribosomal protein S3Ae